MTSGSAKVTPLACPTCRAPLAGGETARLFFCPTCQALLRPTDGGWEPFPVRFAAPGVGRGHPDLFLPFWGFRVTVRAETTDRERQRTLERHPWRLDWVYVNGFAVRGLQLFGDPGLVLTRKQPSWEAFEQPGFLWGAFSPAETAARVAKYQALSEIDRQLDITDVKVSIAVEEFFAWGVPFYDRGEKLVEGLTGAEYGEKLFPDLEDIRAAVRSRAAG